MFSTPGNPAHPPALGQLGRCQPLGLINGQPPRKPRRTAALGSAKRPVCGGEQASLLYLEGRFAALLVTENAGLKTHVEVTRRCPISQEVQDGSSYPPWYR